MVGYGVRVADLEGERRAALLAAELARATCRSTHARGHRARSARDPYTAKRFSGFRRARRSRSSDYKATRAGTSSLPLLTSRGIRGSGGWQRQGGRRRVVQPRSGGLLCDTDRELGRVAAGGRIRGHRRHLILDTVEKIRPPTDWFDSGRARHKRCRTRHFDVYAAEAAEHRAPRPCALGEQLPAQPSVDARPVCTCGSPTRVGARVPGVQLCSMNPFCSVVHYSSLGDRKRDGAASAVSFVLLRRRAVGRAVGRAARRAGARGATGRTGEAAARRLEQHLELRDLASLNTLLSLPIRSCSACARRACISWNDGRAPAAFSLCRSARIALRWSVSACCTWPF